MGCCSERRIFGLLGRLALERSLVVDLERLLGLSDPWEILRRLRGVRRRRNSQRQRGCNLITLRLAQTRRL